MLLDQSHALSSSHVASSLVHLSSSLLSSFLSWTPPLHSAHSLPPPPPPLLSRCSTYKIWQHSTIWEKHWRHSLVLMSGKKGGGGRLSPDFHFTGLIYSRKEGVYGYGGRLSLTSSQKQRRTHKKWNVGSLSAIKRHEKRAKANQKKKKSNSSDENNESFIISWKRQRNTRTESLYVVYSLSRNTFGTQRCNHPNFLQISAVNRPVTCTGWAKNPRGGFTHPADFASLLLIAGWSSSFSLGAAKRGRHYRPRRSLRRGNWLMKRETKRQIWACPRYSVCRDLVFPLTGLKLTERISYTGSGEMWTRSSFWRVPGSARFQGVGDYCGMSVPFWFIVLNIDSLVKQLAALSASCLPPTHWTKVNVLAWDKRLRIHLYSNFKQTSCRCWRHSRLLVLFKDRA